jgi:hypothetical protein
MAKTGRAVVAVGCLVLVGGCLGFVTGSDSLAFTADRTVVGDNALAETGYQHGANETIDRTVNVSAAGQDRRVELTSYAFAYNRTVEAGAAGRDAAAAPAAQFTVLTTPSATVAGQSVNPLARLSTEDLVRRFLGASGAPEGDDLRVEGNRTVRSLGAERTVTAFRSGGNGTTVSVHAATFEVDEDFVVVLATHPERLDERDRVDALLAGLERREA